LFERRFDVQLLYIGRKETAMHEIAATVGSSAVILIGIIAGILFNQRALDKLESRVDARFAQVDARFAQVDARFAQMGSHLGQIEIRLGKVEAEVEGLKVRLDQLGSQVQHLGSRIDRIDSDLQQFFRTQGMLEKAVEILEKRN
jgi:outer membrane murein-binding lipoprotein Lpp